MSCSRIGAVLAGYCLFFSAMSEAGLRGDSQFTYETGLIFAESNSGFSNFEALYHLQGNSTINQFDSQTEADINHDHTDQISSGLVQETRFYFDSPRSPISFLIEQDYDSAWDIGEQPFEEWQNDVSLGPEILINTPAIDELNLDLYFVDERSDTLNQQFIEASLGAQNRISRRQDVGITTYTRQLQFSEPENEYEVALRWQWTSRNGYWSSHIGRHWIETDQILDENSVGSLTFSQMLNSAIEMRIGGRQSVESVDADSPVPESLFTGEDGFYQLQDYWLDISWDQVDQNWFFHNQYSIGQLDNREAHLQSHEIVFHRPVDIGRARPLEAEVGWTTLYESRYASENYLRNDLRVSLGQQTRRELLIQVDGRIIQTPDQNTLSINISLQWTPVR